MDLPAPETKGTQTLQVPAQSNQLATYLILLLGYQQWLPHWLDISWGGGKVTKVLTSIKMALNLLEQGNKELASMLQVKAICLVSNMDSMALAPNQVHALTTPELKSVTSGMFKPQNLAIYYVAYIT